MGRPGNGRGGTIKNRKSYSRLPVFELSLLFLERPVDDGKSPGELVRKLIEPRIAVDHVDEADLDAVKLVGVVEKTELQAVGVHRNVHQSGFQPLEIALVVIDPAVLPADE